MNKQQALLQFGALMGILIVLNILANFFYGYWDLTEDKRFSITAPTKKLVKNLEDKVFVTIYLAGEFPTGFRRLQTATIDMVDKLRSYNRSIDYQIIDPNEGTPNEINERLKKLKEIGVAPMRLNVVDNAERSEKFIFPYAAIAYKGRITTIKLLENQVPGMPQAVVLNNSEGLLEYKFAHALKTLQTSFRPFVVFLEGHGELTPFETADFEKTLRQFYEVGRINLDSVPLIDPKIKVLIIAKPTQSIPEKHQLAIDQYIMNGGNTLWLVDKLGVNLDSLRGRKVFVPIDYPLDIDPMLFKYGVRLSTDLVVDLQCTKIPQVVGVQGNAPQFEFFHWWYHPMATPTADHPIVKNMDKVNLFFATQLELVGQPQDPIQKTILLTTSERSRIQRHPTEINFDILHYPVQAERFNKPNLPLAVLLEGEFPSFFKNKLTPEWQSILQQLNRPFKEKSQPTKMLVVADGDIAKNFINPVEQSYKPLGFNPYVKYQFANRDFLLNTIEYMLDDAGIIAARTKEVKLRLLDKTKAQAEKSYWRFLNLVVPLLFLIAFGVGYYYWRRYRYAR